MRQSISCFAPPEESVVNICVSILAMLVATKPSQLCFYSMHLEWYILWDFWAPPQKSQNANHPKMLKKRNEFLHTTQIAIQL